MATTAKSAFNAATEQVDDIFEDAFGPNWFGFFQREADRIEEEQENPTTDPWKKLHDNIESAIDGITTWGKDVGEGISNWWNNITGKSNKENKTANTDFTTSLDRVAAVNGLLNGMSSSEPSVETSFQR